MAETFYGTNFSNSRFSYEIPKHWTKRIDKKNVLVSTHHGPWVILKNKEFDLFRFEKIHTDPTFYEYMERKNIIITKKNRKDIINEYKCRYSTVFQGTSLHIVAPTLRCNHNCIYCHAVSRPMDAKGYDMDEETAEKVVKFIFQTPSPVITIEFQGGEPLANFPIIKYITERAKEINKELKKSVHFCIVTNLTMMDKKKLDFFIKNEFNINTSLDGPEELHNKNRTFTEGNSYKETVEWLQKLKNMGYTKIGALPTISRYSLDYPEKIVDEYLKQGFKSLRVRPMNDAGIANKTWKEIGYSAEEFIEFWKRYIKYVFKLNKEGIKVSDETIQVILSKLFHKDYFCYTCWGSPCGAALQQSAYDHEGNVYTCDESRSFDFFRLGNVKKQSYREIYCSPQTTSMINISSQTSSLCDACAYHAFCGPCPVCSYGSYGSPISKIPLDRMCKIRKSIIDFLFKTLVSKDKEIILNWAKRGKLGYKPEDEEL